MIKRFYTWEHLTNSLYMELSNITKYTESKKITVRMNIPSFCDKLNKIGINLINKQYNVLGIEYPVVTETEADAMELEFKRFLNSINVDLQSVRANIDYDVVSEKVMGGMLCLTEEVVIPGNITNIEAMIYIYIDNLCAKNDVVYITDPYLYYNNVSSDYKDMLVRLLNRTAAKEIVSVMPNNRNNSIYQDIKNRTNGIRHTFKVCNDCHDRFWISEKSQKGFVMGTSLNGVGSKICRLDMLKQDEVNILLAELKRLN